MPATSGGELLIAPGRAGVASNAPPTPKFLNSPLTALRRAHLSKKHFPQFPGPTSTRRHLFATSNASGWHGYPHLFSDAGRVASPRRPPSRPSLESSCSRSISEFGARYTNARPSECTPVPLGGDEAILRTSESCFSSPQATVFHLVQAENSQRAGSKQDPQHGRIQALPDQTPFD
jgi:hypothetical protein